MTKQSISAIDLLAKPGFDPFELSSQQKLELVRQSDGAFIDLLEGCELDILFMRKMCQLDHLPSGLYVKQELVIDKCLSFTKLDFSPTNARLQITRSTLREINCNIYVQRLDLCQNAYLVRWNGKVRVENWVDLSDCISLERLPDDFKVGSWLNLNGCTSLKALPPHLDVGDTIYLSQCNPDIIIPPTIKYKSIVLPSHPHPPQPLS